MTKHGPRSGQEPGKSEPTPPEQKRSGARPVAEEDVFGGAERAQQKNEKVRTDTAKP